MWHALGYQVNGDSSTEGWILLVDNKKRCLDLHQKMARMPAIRGCLQCAPEEIHQTCTPWPFSQWEVYILGSFPLAKGQVKFLIVTVDYFTKWIEAEPIATITAQKVQSFLWKQVIYHHGLPHSVVTDNGRQFTDHHLEQFLKRLGIKHLVTSINTLRRMDRRKPPTKSY